MYTGELVYTFLVVVIFLLNSAGLAQGLLILSFAAAEIAFGLSLFFFCYLINSASNALDLVFRYNICPKYNIKI
jgi:NADH:ubiquinone oxidoreductase subunit K